MIIKFISVEWMLCNQSFVVGEYVLNVKFSDVGGEVMRLVYWIVQVSVFSGLVVLFQKLKVKNVILFIVDGMGWNIFNVVKMVVYFYNLVNGMFIGKFVMEMGLSSMVIIIISFYDSVLVDSVNMVSFIVMG